MTRDEFKQCLYRSASRQGDENREANRQAISADVAAFLARGGRIDHPEPVQIRCEIASDNRTGSTQRRYVGAVPSVGTIKRARYGSLA